MYRYIRYTIHDIRRFRISYITIYNSSVDAITSSKSIKYSYVTVTDFIVQVILSVILCFFYTYSSLRPFLKLVI